jgi:glycosyltransferase involved in cell wall biosynthesis
VERLIHAVSLLSIPYHFYIIGKGNKRGHLQHLINDLQLQEKIFLQGEKKEPFNGMEDADLFLMGSYYEGFPNVLLEAGSLGIPVISFNAPGGIREIITEGENGLLVADNDLRAFAAAVNKGITSGFDRNKIIESTQSRFSIDATMKKLENLLVQL